MKTSTSGLAAVALGLAASFLSGEEPQDAPLRNVRCRPEDPAHACPGPSCRCAPDSLEILFEGGGHIFEYASFEENHVFIDVVVAARVKSDKVQGFSLGVLHDGEVLELLEARPRLPCRGEFGPCSEGLAHQPVEVCGEDPVCGIADRKPAAGWVVGWVLSFIEPVSLPPGLVPLFQARYRLLQDAGLEGTRIRFTGRMARVDSPPVDLSLTIDGRSYDWSATTDGLVRRANPGIPFIRGDANNDSHLNVTDAVTILEVLFGGRAVDIVCEDAIDADDDGRLSISDAVRLLQYLFERGPGLLSPGRACGIDPTPDALGCRHGTCG